MKNAQKNLFGIVVFVILTLSVTYSYGQGSPPPPPNGGNTGSNQNGGNAPIGGGLFILIGLGAIYGGKKIHKLYMDDNESFED